MKHILMAAVISLLLAVAATPGRALEYSIDAADGGLFAPSSAVEQITVIGGGPTERDNIDRSKKAAKMPPHFGSPESYIPGTGTAITPQVSSGGGVSVSSGAGIYGASGGSTLSAGTSGISSGGGSAGGSNDNYYPPAQLDSPGSAELTVSTSNKFTLPDGLFYSDGSLGRLKIPKLDLNVKVYEDESLENLAKGAGHFKSTSCWDGNVGIAGHNRGVTNHFGKIHTLTAGDQIVYTTQKGTRTYEVFYVGQVSETDFSRLERSNENLITLVTCVRDVREMRWCVQAREVK